jgi:hypothetical protein
MHLFGSVNDILKLVVICSRADEWNVNKWAWEGALKVVSKGEDCIIKLEDKNTGMIVTLVLLIRICEVCDNNCLIVFQESCMLGHFSERVNHTQWNL